MCYVYSANIKTLLVIIVVFFGQTVVLPLLIISSLVSRIIRKKNVSVGFGPEPINPFHSKSLSSLGIPSKSYITHKYYIGGDFDVDLSRSNAIFHLFDTLMFRSAFHALFNYNILFFYFHGGPIGFSSKAFWRLEWLILKLAGIKSVVMPYGGDVQDLRRNPNPLYKDALSIDYPSMWTRERIVARKVNHWQRRADHVISGCDWVNYMSYWDTLCISHFAIDLRSIDVVPSYRKESRLKVLHAPNHQAIKGTEALMRAIEKLQSEGLEIELTLIQKKPNSEVLKAIEECDLVVEQLVIGWYAQFAIEAMAYGKPVVSHIDRNLMSLYASKGLLDEKEFPIISADCISIEETLRDFYYNSDSYQDRTSSGPEYVEKHHSLEAIGALFSGIVEDLN